MDKRIRAGIVGGSGYAGGELIRLLISHPHIRAVQATSERLSGKRVWMAHPHLRKRTDLAFRQLRDLEDCDVLFLCMPHGKSSGMMDFFMRKAPRIIDLSADFRLHDPVRYERWYGTPHPRKDLLEKFVYGIPELHREEMCNANLISSAGCNATATILALYPLFRKGIVENGKTVVEVKVGSSEAGNEAGRGSHHPERAHSIRSYAPTRHRHAAEAEQELESGTIHFTATALDMVRGILATCHVFLNQDIDEKGIWRIYREAYQDEPFIRIVKESEGNYRYPEPKLLWGTNYCDIGFEKDQGSNRLVVISAIDNIMKGAAGQALQACNIMHGLDERTGLDFPGLHPI